MKYTRSLYQALIIILVFCVNPSCRAQKADPAKDEAGLRWIYSDAQFRVPITVNSGLYARKDVLVNCKLDMKKLLSEAGIGVMEINNSSIRLFMADELNEKQDLPCLYKADSPENGELVWRISGEMEPLAFRSFYLYFDPNRDTKHTPSSNLLIINEDEAISNAVRNGSFEEIESEDKSRAHDWKCTLTGAALGSMRVVEDEAHTGARSLQITCQSANGYYTNVVCQQEKIVIRPKRLYEFRVWIKPRGKLDPKIQLLITGWVYRTDGKHALLAGIPGNWAKFQRGVEIEPEGWHQVVIRGLANTSTKNEKLTPEDTAYCSLELRLYRADNGPIKDCGVYLDDMEIMEIKSNDMMSPVEISVGKIERQRK